MILITILIFILIIGVLIFVHEFGHFLAAKKAGVKVEELAFGFPPKIYSWKKGETRYAINLIPLGGYVRLLGEEDQIDKPGSFHSKSVPSRISIVVMGVLMNFVLGIILMTVGFSIGMTPLVSDPAEFSGKKTSQVIVVFVEENSPAQKAGIEQGMILNGFSSTTDLQNYTRSHLGQEVTLSVQKNQHPENITVNLSQDQQAPMGVAVVSITQVKQSVPQAFVTSIKETGKVIATVFTFIVGILKHFLTTGKAGPAAAGVAGPVGLFNFTSEAIKIGWIYVLQLVILLSINLGLINILPFPALDGGKALFLVLEGVFKKKIVRQEIENIIHMIGFALLIILLLAITYKDIINLK